MIKRKRTKDNLQGRIQDFKLGGALKKIAPSEGRRENCWGISCEKSRFYAKKSYFFPILGGTRAGCAPPLDPPLTWSRKRYAANKQLSSMNHTIIRE
jgi:hypothetical protein